MQATIIGAGIGGLTAALCLHHHGIAPSVYEQAPALTEVGAGIQLGPNAMRVLSAIGLEDEILGLGSIPQALSLRSAYSGADMLRIDLLVDGKPRWRAPYVHIHRADLIEVLARAARQRGITLHFGKRIADVAAFADVDVIVAADGMASALAQQALARKAPDFSGHVAWRALVPTDQLRWPLPLESAAVWSGRKCHAVTYPLRDGSLMNFIGVAETDTSKAADWDLEEPAETVLQRFRGFPAAVLGLIRAAGTLKAWGLYTQPLGQPWTDGRIVLLGDAAHAMLPYLAQGGAMAVEGAWVLAACLGADERPAQALKRYESVRRARAEQVADASKRVGGLYHLQPMGARLGAIAALSGASQLGADRLAKVLDWLYGHDVTEPAP